MADRYIQIPIKKEVQIKFKALKGQDSYSVYLDRLMRSGSKQND